jgi:predicted AlkP superfamily pyrophosphatase or phosphodiesterase
MGLQRPTRGVRLLALVLFLALAIGACRHAASDAPLILVSLDGFAARFLAMGETPTIARLAEQGAHATDGMVPVFPTKTFPNHYTIVTGLYTEHHGIVANNMYDPELDATFSLSNRDAIRDPRWWGGEPVWVTAERQGVRTAPYFWPGSEAAIGGVRPSYWEPFDGSVPDSVRVDKVLSWLDLPEDRRPRFVTLYSSAVDGAAHNFGTQSPELRDALRAVDAAVARLLAGLEARGLAGAVNLVLVSDHGMADTSPDRVITIDDYLDLSSIRVSDWSPVAALWPAEGEHDAVLRVLQGAGRPWTVYRREEIPERFHFRAHRRIAPIIAIADDGWAIAQRARLESRPERYAGATHGYDHELPSMRALFVATGPAVRPGVDVPPFENVHLYELFCAMLGIEPAENDGELAEVAGILRQSAIGSRQ